MESGDRLSEDECEEISRQLENGWRIRCPHGHASLDDNDGPSVYCKTCNEGYRYAELVDARASSDTVVVSPPGQRHR